MTQIELEATYATKRMCNAVTKRCEEIDWEQRRYEIARNFMCSRISGLDYYPDADKLSKTAVEYADVLIAELKK